MANGDHGFDAGREFGNIEAKLDNVIIAQQNLSQGLEKLGQNMGQRVQDHGESISGMKKDVTNNQSHIGWVSKKIDKYMVWLIGILSSVVGLIFWHVSQGQ